MIRLFFNLYTDPDPARNAELEMCRQLNAAAFENCRAIDGRVTFADILRRVNDFCAIDDISIIANADIYFDDWIRCEAELSLTENEAWALTRWESAALFSDENGPRVDSQDAWVFCGPIREKLIAKCDFLPGVRGCDNRLAAEIALAGYRVSNPSKSVRAMHLHRCGVRRYSNDPKDHVPKPYLLIPPHELGETPQLRWVMN